MQIVKKVSLNTDSDNAVNQISRMLIGVYGHDYHEKDMVGKKVAVVFYPANHLFHNCHNGHNNFNDDSKNLSITVVGNKVKIRFVPNESWSKPPYSLMFDKICSIIDQISEHYSVAKK